MKVTKNKKLRELLLKELKEAITSDSVALLDVPNYYNPGDQLIWQGEIEILNKLKKKVNYISSLHFFNKKQINISDTILMQGGGNFGDLYAKHLNFRRSVVDLFPENKIIILPVTVHFSDKEKLIKVANEFSKHKKLTICARDKQSFDLLIKHFDNEILMLPDTAFGIETIKKKEINYNNPKILYMKRTDKEFSKNISSDEMKFLGEYDISDWPTYKYLYLSLLLHLFFLNLNRLILYLINILGFHWNEKYDVYGLLKFHSKEYQIQTGIDFLRQYDLIITTRLHGHIAACLLEIPNILLDNSYGKNKNLYTTWMEGNETKSYYAQSINDVKRFVNEIHNHPS